jgi:nickel transport protein
MRKLLLVWTLMTLPLWAHDYWLKPSGKRVVIAYGHGSETEAYSASVIKKATAVTPKGPHSLSWQQEGPVCVLQPDSDATQVGVEIDSGYWTKTVQGWKNQSKREAGNYLLSEWSLYYSKLLLKPNAPHKVMGHRLEFVPLEVDHSEVRLRLLLNGQPLAGKAIYSQHSKLGETDSKGEIKVKRDGDVTVVSASHKEPVENNPDADRLNLHAVLTL